MSAWARVLLDRVGAGDRTRFEMPRATSGPAVLRPALEAQAELARTPEVCMP
jgi:hypothetical protein